VTFTVRKVPANFTSMNDVDVWEVIKIPQTGDLYVLGTFDNESLARWCLDSLRMSVEVKRGAEVLA
jgi:hypothetical protein